MNQTPQTTKNEQATKNTTKYLIYLTIGLLMINFILIFLPFVKVYQPSYSKTVLGVTKYEGWYTQSAPMVMFIFPIFLTGIPYLCSMISVSNEFTKKNNKNSFFKIKNNTLTKPIRFFWLKFASILNLIMMWYAFSNSLDQVAPYMDHGAYCHITFWGVLNIICTIGFIVCLFVLSRQTKSMFTLVNKGQLETTETQQTNEIETKENVQ